MKMSEHKSRPSRWAPPTEQAPPEDKILNGTANKTIVNNKAKGKGAAPVSGLEKAKQMLRAVASQKKFAQASSVTPSASKVPEKEKKRQKKTENAEKSEKAEKPQKTKLGQLGRQFELVTEIEMMKSSDALARRMLLYNIPLWLLEPSLLPKLQLLDGQRPNNIPDTNDKTAFAMPTDRMPKIGKFLGAEDVNKLFKKAEFFERRGITIKYRLIKESLDPPNNVIDLIAIRADTGEPLEHSLKEKMERNAKKEEEEKKIRVEDYKSTQSRRYNNRLIQKREQEYEDTKKRGAMTGHEAVKDYNEQEVKVERWRRHGRISGRPRSRSRSRSRSEGPSRIAERKPEEEYLRKRRKRVPDEHEGQSPVEDRYPIEDQRPVANGYSNVNQQLLQDDPGQWNVQYSYNGYWPSNVTPAAAASTSYNPQSYWAQGYGRNPYSQPSAVPSAAPLNLNPFPDRPETSSAPPEVQEEPDLSSEYEKFLNEVTNTVTPQEEDNYNHMDSLDWSGGISRYSKESNLTQIKTIDRNWR